MSVRAYKVIEILHEDEPTFNLTSNANLVQLSDSEDNSFLLFDRERVQEAIDNGNKTPEELAILNKIIEDMEDNTYVEYYCY